MKFWCEKRFFFIIYEVPNRLPIYLGNWFMLGCCFLKWKKSDNNSKVWLEKTYMFFSNSTRRYMMKMITQITIFNDLWYESKFTNSYVNSSCVYAVRLIWLSKNLLYWLASNGIHIFPSTHKRLITWSLCQCSVSLLQTMIYSSWHAKLKRTIIFVGLYVSHF